MNGELPDVQTGFRKGRETRDQIVNIHWIIEKTREFQKTSTTASLTILKPLTVHSQLWTILNEMGIPDHLTCPRETCIQDKKQQLELDMEHRLVQNWEKSMRRLYIVTLFTYMQRVCMLSHFSHVQLFVILWTVAHQAPLSMEFSTQEHWSGLPFPSPFWALFKCSI